MDDLLIKHLSENDEHAGFLKDISAQLNKMPKKMVLKTKLEIQNLVYNKLLSLEPYDTAKIKIL